MSQLKVEGRKRMYSTWPQWGEGQRDRAHYQVCLWGSEVKDQRWALAKVWFCPPLTHYWASFSPILQGSLVNCWTKKNLLWRQVALWLVLCPSPSVSFLGGHSHFFGVHCLSSLMDRETHISLDCLNFCQALYGWGEGSASSHGIQQ